MGYFNFANGITAINDTNLNAMQKGLMQLVFPVGSTYITQADTNPSTILGFGTWERIKGRVLVGLDENDTSFNVIGKTGGEKAHQLTSSELPSHSLKITIGRSGEATHSHYAGNNNIVAEAANGTNDEYDSNTSSIGNDEAHNNLQPYEVVGYMWIRRS